MPKVQQYPVNVEEYPDTYTGPRFLTLIEYGNEQYLTIVDYTTPTTVAAYVLDACQSEHMDPAAIVTLINENIDAIGEKPVSILFGALGMSQQMARIHRTFSLSDIGRVIGRFPYVDLSQSKTVKRRRRREIGRSIEIRAVNYS